MDRSYSKESAVQMVGSAVDTEIKVKGDAHARFRQFGDGSIEFGTGSAAPKGTVKEVSFSPAAGGANVCEVTITLNHTGRALPIPTIFPVWLSDAATGAGLTATTASGTVTAKTASGTVIGTLTSKKALSVQSKADGTFILEITDSAKTGWPSLRSPTP